MLGRNKGILQYNINFSRGGNFRYIREFGFCAKFSSREIFLTRNFPPRENKILIAVYASIICNKNGAFVHITNSSQIVGIHPD